MVTTLDTRINGSVMNGTICPNVTSSSSSSSSVKQTDDVTDNERINSYPLITSQQSSNSALTHSSSQIKRSIPQCNPVISQSISSLENTNRIAKDTPYAAPMVQRGDRQFILPQSESSMTPLHVNCDTVGTARCYKEKKKKLILI